jgi:Tol biopolymer transport system component
MKRYEKAIVLFIAAALMLSTFSTSFAADTSSAKKLNTMGLLDDASEKSLNESLSRMIGLTMILKSLGYTTESVSTKAAGCPFSDVPEWFRGWAATAIDLGITTGISQTEFNPNGKLTQKMFYVFQLRALGYNKDASWNNTESMAVSAGLIKKGTALNAKAFTKRDATEVMFAALKSTVQGQGIRLIDKLVNENVVSKSKAAAAGLKIEQSGLGAGETLAFKNALDAKLSANGKILVWQDNYMYDYDNKGKRNYVNLATGEKFSEDNAKFYIRGMDLETGKKFVVCEINTIYGIMAISSDGKTILCKKGEGFRNDGIFAVDLETGRKTTVLDNTNNRLNYHFSPNGTMIFWHSNDTPEEMVWDNDIYAKNWMTGEEYVICEAEKDQYLEDMTPDGKIVIWSDYRNWGEYSKLYIDIYGKNLETGEEFVIKDGPEVSKYSMDSRNRMSPRMSDDGKIIVYEMDREDILPAAIYGMNMETGEEFAICDDGNGYKQSPVISGNGEVVVWLDNRNAQNMRSGEYSYNNTDIFGKNLKTGEELAIGIMPGRQANAKISYDGRIVVWQDQNNVDGWDIFGKDLKTGKNLVICNDKGSQDLIDMSSDGRIVVWEQDADVYVKKLALSDK